MSNTFENLTKNKNFKQLLEQIPEQDRKDVEQNIKVFLEKFDVNLGILFEAIEKLPKI